jgi:hypothetical protein
MSDPFEVWRLAWSTALTSSLELLGDVFAPHAALSAPQESCAIDFRRSRLSDAFASTLTPCFCSNRAARRRRRIQ